MRGFAHNGRPGTIPELLTHGATVGFRRAFVEFLDEFYRCPSPAALEDPPDDVGPEMVAFLAAMAEALAESMGWAVPRWTRLAVVSPPVVWEVFTGALPDAPRIREILTKQAHPTFRRHGILVRGSVLARC